MSWRPHVSEKEGGAEINVVPVCPARSPDNGASWPHAGQNGSCTCRRALWWLRLVSSAGRALEAKGWSQVTLRGGVKQSAGLLWAWPSLGSWEWLVKGALGKIRRRAEAFILEQERSRTDALARAWRLGVGSQPPALPSVLCLHRDLAGVYPHSLVAPWGLHGPFTAQHGLANGVPGSKEHHYAL